MEKQIIIRIDEQGRVSVLLSDDMTVRELLTALEAAQAQVLNVVIKARGGGE